METIASNLLHHNISRKMGIEIIEGKWKHESIRTLEGVQSRFNVSRTVAREASRQLESMGLIRTRRRLGLIAQGMDFMRLHIQMIVDIGYIKDL